jgi:hypothetical protein
MMMPMSGSTNQVRGSSIMDAAAHRH